jgi:ubiquinol-cytochrome c reductase core subunit 2
MWKRSIILHRNFAAAASTNPAVSSLEQKVSKLGNGLTVASIDARGPISHLVLTFRAGSRYEQPDEIGLVHRLRNSIGLDTEKYEGIRLVWQAGSLGGSLSATASQDFLTLHLAAPREQASVALSLLGELSQPAFKPWDLDDTNSSLKYDLAFAEPFDHLYDSIHRAAYRNGSLANALLSPPFRIGKVNYKTLNAFKNSHLVTGEAAIFAFNMDHDSAVSYAKDQPSIQEGKGKAPKPSPYIGGENRVQASTHLAHVAIVGEGGKLSDTKSAAVQAVLSAVIGQGPNSKFSTASGVGVVAQAVQKAANHNPVGISALNILHSDSGLAGVYLVADGARIEPYVRAAVSALKQLGSNGPSQEDLEVAKKLSAANVLYRAESAAEIAQDQAAQLLVNSNPVTPLDFVKLIEGVNGDDVKKAAAKLTSKLSLAAYGTIDQVPLVGQL